MKKEPKIFLQHIIDSIEAVEEYMNGITQKEFKNNQQIQDAVIRRIEIIGEAAKNVSSDFRKKYPQVDWKEMAGMRDIVVHEYFGVDLNIIWNTIDKDLPRLKNEISKILEQLGGQIILPIQ